MATKRDPRLHFCATCGAANAAWGYKLPRAAKADGKPATIMLWYCYAHRGNGQARLAEANLAHGHGHGAVTPAPTATPAPPAKPRPQPRPQQGGNQLGFDL